MRTTAWLTETSIRSMTKEICWRWRLIWRIASWSSGLMTRLNSTKLSGRIHQTEVKFDRLMKMFKASIQSSLMDKKFLRFSRCQKSRRWESSLHLGAKATSLSLTPIAQKQTLRAPKLNSKLRRIGNQKSNYYKTNQKVRKQSSWIQIKVRGTI